jgi:hypothetical protein
VDAAGQLAQLLQRQRARRVPSATLISRCWAPSWRSRSIRRRDSSEACTILARDAISSRCASVLAIACDTSSENAAIRCSASAGGGASSSTVDTVRPPQRRPLTRIGAATAAFTPIISRSRIA